MLFFSVTTIPAMGFDAIKINECADFPAKIALFIYSRNGRIFRQDPAGRHIPPAEKGGIANAKKQMLCPPPGGYGPQSPKTFSIT